MGGGGGGEGAKVLFASSGSHALNIYQNLRDVAPLLIERTIIVWISSDAEGILIIP